MAFLTVSGEPGCRVEEVARLVAQRLGFTIVTEARLRELVAEEFGSETTVPEKAWSAAVTAILAHIATEQPLVICVPGAELLFGDAPSVLRVQIVAREQRRIGMLMLDHRLDRPAAKHLLRQLERQEKDARKGRFGRASLTASDYDLVCNVEHFDADPVAALIEQAAGARGLTEDRLLSQAAEQQIQFQMRMRLAKFDLAPPGKVSLKRKPFANRSEEIFANLLDFYRIGWEYEPKSFAVQFDAGGRAMEFFTPDFYLPEFDLYVELTTMKQSLVTKKNRKVKLLRTIYPHINIQVFYQKDFRNLIFKHGLAERGVLV